MTTKTTTLEYLFKNKKRTFFRVQTTANNSQPSSFLFVVRGFSCGGEVGNTIVDSPLGVYKIVHRCGRKVATAGEVVHGLTKSVRRFFQVLVTTFDTFLNN